MLSSLILLDLFQSAQDFANASEIANLLGQQVKVKKVSGNKVEIEDGVITLDEKFRPFERQGSSKRNNIAVWDLVGKVKFGKDVPAASMKAMTKKKSKKVEGGNSDNDQRILAVICQERINNEIAGIQNAVAGQAHDCCLLNFVARVLRGWVERGDHCRDAILKARCVLTKDPYIDFFILTSSEVFCAREILDGYGPKENPDIKDNNVDFVRNFFGSGTQSLLQRENAKIIKEPDQLEAHINGFKARILNMLPNSFCPEIKKYYLGIRENNAFPSLGFGVDSMSDVYPAAFCEVIKRPHMSQLALDEFKFFAYEARRKINEEPISENPRQKANAYQNLFDTIRDCFGNKIGCSGRSLIEQGQFSPEDVKRFISSFAFYFARDNVQNVVGRGEDSDDEDDDEHPVVRGCGEELDEYSKDLVHVGGEIDAELRGFANQAFSISGGAMDELRRYVKAHNGEFPQL